MKYDAFISYRHTPLDMEMAKKLVDTAKACGADIVKFQTAKLDSLVSKSAHMADYQKKNTDDFPHYHSPPKISASAFLA